MSMSNTEVIGGQETAGLKNRLNEVVDELEKLTLLAFQP